MQQELLLGGIKSEFSVKRVPIIKFGQHLNLLDASTLEERLFSKRMSSEDHENVTPAELKEL